MPKKRKFTRAQLDVAMEKAWARFSRRANFTGVDIGYRYDSAVKTDDLCIRIHVERKLPIETVPESEVFPDNIDGVPLDVIEGLYRATRSTNAKDHQKRHSHVLGGVSCGRIGGDTGTIGVPVVDKRTGRLAILSNWHVLAGAEPKRATQFFSRAVSTVVGPMSTRSLISTDGCSACQATPQSPP